MNQIKIDTERKAWWCHYQLWKWLSENPTKEKKEWAGWGVYITDRADENLVLHHCAACEWACLQAERNYCDHCPIDWETDPNHCENPGALFVDWENEEDPAERTRIALLIRDAWPEPFRELEYRGIDNWNRPMFIQRGTKYYYSALDILFPYGESEVEVKKRVSEKDITFHGQSWDCDPVGTNAGKIKIMWSV